MLRRAALLSLAMSLLGGPLAAQNPVAISIQGGELGADVSGAYRSFATSPSAFDAAYQQWLRIPISGFLVDRRVFRYALTLRPAFRQQTSTLMGEDLTSRTLGLDFAATLLQTKPLSLNLTASRAAGSAQGGFGADTEFRSSTFGASLAWRNQMLPATLSYARRAFQDEWGGAPGRSPIVRDEGTETLRLSARSSKTYAYIERLVFEDHANGFDFESIEWAVDHALRWGKGSALESRVGQLERTGYNPYDRSSWSERLRLQHTYALGTEYQYDYQSWTNGSPATSRTLAGAILFRPTSWLSTSTRASSQSYHVAEGRTSRDRLIPDVSLQLELPGNVRLSGGASLGYERLERELPGETFIRVLGEAHTVDDTRSFVLENAGIDRASVVLRNETATLIYRLDIDYRITEVGALVQIFVPPASRIQEGDVVYADYRYRAQSSGRFESWNIAYNAGASWGGLSIRHGRTQREETPLDAGGGLVQGTDMWTSLGLSRRTPIGHVQVYASLRDRSIREIAYRIHEARAAWTPPPLGSLQLSFDAAVNKTSSTISRSDNETASATANWTPARSLRLGASLDAWRWQPDGAPADQYYGGHLTLDWRFGQIQVNARYDHNRRYLATEMREHRWSLYALRRF